MDINEKAAVVAFIDFQLEEEKKAAKKAQQRTKKK